MSESLEWYTLRAGTRPPYWFPVYIRRENKWSLYARYPSESCGQAPSEVTTAAYLLSLAGNEVRVMVIPGSDEPELEMI